MIKTLLILTIVVSLCSCRQESVFMPNSKIASDDSLKLNLTWKRFLQAVDKKDAQAFKQLCYDKVECDICVAEGETQIMPIDSFMVYIFQTLPGSPVWKAIEKRGYKLCESIIPQSKPEIFAEDTEEQMALYEVWVHTYQEDEWIKGHEGQNHGFRFVKADNGFKFCAVTTIP